MCSQVSVDHHNAHVVPAGPVGPINREMRHLISSLQNHNLQLKGDVQRYKRKLRETQVEINKVSGPPARALRWVWSEQHHKAAHQLHLLQKSCLEPSGAGCCLERLVGPWEELKRYADVLCV